MSENKKNQVDKVNSTDSTPKKAKAPAAEKTAATKSVAKAEKPATNRVVRLRDKYRNEIIAVMRDKFKYSNVNEVPKLEKIVLNMGLGADKDNAKSMQNALEEMKQISGQKPVATTAKVSVANFKVREGQSIGAKVTLRGSRMYDFLDKLISIALPRVRDFRGLSSKSFDGRGNYSMGVKEQLIFPEITYEQVDRTRGMDICIVTTAKSDEEALELLRAFGMPFKN